MRGLTPKALQNLAQGGGLAEPWVGEVRFIRHSLSPLGPWQIIGGGLVRHSPSPQSQYANKVGDGGRRKTT